MIAVSGEVDSGAPVAAMARAIDLGHLGRMTLGERSLEREVLILFVRQGDMLRRRMRQSAPAVIAVAAHTLKGSALGVGAFRVAGAAAAVESAKAADLAAALDGLDAALDEAKAAVAALLPEL